MEILNQSIPFNTKIGPKSTTIDVRYCLVALVFMTIYPNILFFALNGYVNLTAGVVLATFVASGVAILFFFQVRKENIKLPLTPEIILFCCLLGALLCILGGEGRFFYANIDWQVRDALLNDLATHPWPFAYVIDGSTWDLRAPTAIYLVPALVGKAAGLTAAKLMFLAQNALYLGLLFAAVAALVDGTRARILAVIIVAVYGGMAIVGYTVRNLIAGQPIDPDHIESWSSYQFSSTITQIFWVPHHCFPGFFFAIVYVMWLRHRMTWWLPLAVVPMMGFWSPLAMIGALPFALHSGLTALATRQIDRARILLPAIVMLICLGAIIYLRSGVHSIPVQFGFSSSFAEPEVAAGGLVGWIKHLARYVFFIGLSAAPSLALLAMGRKRIDLSWTTWLIAAAVLLLVPLVWFGEGLDFCMRASIPALFIIAIQMALLVTSYSSKVTGLADKLLLSASVFVLFVGSVTGGLEIKRALRENPVMATCNFVDAWHQSTFSKLSMDTYLARDENLPPILRPRNPDRIAPDASKTSCWTGVWKNPF